MGNLVATIKRFLGNKNTVTILAVLAGVIVLWYFYNYRVDQAITTIQIPYAIEKIDTGKKIESDNIEYKEITTSTLEDSDIITDMAFLEGKYICTGTSIPANGFFYESQICEEKDIENSLYDNIPEGFTVFTLNVDNETTYANSIMPGDYIDLYMAATDDDDQVLYGPLIESIEVLAVRDSSGKDVFWDSDAGDSAFLLFAVPEDYHKLLNISKLITGYSINITPVPRSASYTANPGETQIGSEELYYFIMSKAATLTE
ncbi:MAG: hypothetical protein IJY87_04030 [Bacilli bacterium]|nr:hypothetical protein [Bacilli bacterium]MBQ8902220.1 hypothetical protein [Bacilli bacterium]